jgi:hypothetical protein
MPICLSHLITSCSSYSSEANRCSTSREIPCLLWSLKVYKNLPLVSILNHINSVHSVTPYLSCIYFNIILPFKLISSTWSVSCLIFWMSCLNCMLHTLPISSSLDHHSLSHVYRFWSSSYNFLCLITILHPLTITLYREYVGKLFSGWGLYLSWWKFPTHSSQMLGNESFSACSSWY